MGASGRTGILLHISRFVVPRPPAGAVSSVAPAEADYEVGKDLHAQAGLIDAYHAAVLGRVRRRRGQDRQAARRRLWAKQVEADIAGIEAGAEACADQAPAGG